MIVKINVDCVYCNNQHSMSVVKENFEAWRNGTLIQDAMPYLSSGERELLISNTCNNCWVEMFGSINDDDDDDEDEDPTDFFA